MYMRCLVVSQVDSQGSRGVVPHISGIVAVDHDHDDIACGNLNLTGVDNGIAVGPLGIAVDIGGHVVDNIHPVLSTGNGNDQSAVLLSGVGPVVALRTRLDESSVVAQNSLCGVFHGANRIGKCNSELSISIAIVDDCEVDGHTGVSRGNNSGNHTACTGVQCYAVYDHSEVRTGNGHDHAGEVAVVVVGLASSNSQSSRLSEHTDGVVLVACVVGLQTADAADTSVGVMLTDSVADTADTVSPLVVAFDPSPADGAEAAIASINRLGGVCASTVEVVVADAVAVFVDVISGCGECQAAAVSTFAVNTVNPCAVLVTETGNKAAAVVADAVFTCGSIVVCTAKAFDFCATQATGAALASENIVIAVAVALVATDFTDDGLAVGGTLGTDTVNSNSNRIVRTGHLSQSFVEEVCAAVLAVPILNITGVSAVNSILGLNISDDAVRCGQTPFATDGAHQVAIGSVGAVAQLDAADITVVVTIVVSAEQVNIDNGEQNIFTGQGNDAVLVGCLSAFGLDCVSSAGDQAGSCGSSAVQLHAGGGNSVVTGPASVNGSIGLEVLFNTVVLGSLDGGQNILCIDDLNVIEQESCAGVGVDTQLNMEVHNIFGNFPNHLVVSPLVSIDSNSLCIDALAVSIKVPDAAISIAGVSLTEGIILLGAGSCLVGSTDRLEGQNVGLAGSSIDQIGSLDIQAAAIAVGLRGSSDGNHDLTVFVNGQGAALPTGSAVGEVAVRHDGSLVHGQVVHIDGAVSKAGGSIEAVIDSYYALRNSKGLFEVLPLGGGFLCFRIRNSRICRQGRITVYDVAFCITVENKQGNAASIRVIDITLCPARNGVGSASLNRSIRSHFNVLLSVDAVDPQSSAAIAACAIDQLQVDPAGGATLEGTAEDHGKLGGLQNLALSLSHDKVVQREAGVAGKGSIHIELNIHICGVCRSAGGQSFLDPLVLLADSDDVLFQNSAVLIHKVHVCTAAGTDGVACAAVIGGLGVHELCSVSKAGNSCNSRSLCPGDGIILLENNTSARNSMLVIHNTGLVGSGPATGGNIAIKALGQQSAVSGEGDIVHIDAVHVTNEGVETQICGNRACGNSKSSVELSPLSAVGQLVEGIVLRILQSAVTIGIQELAVFAQPEDIQGNLAGGLTDPSCILLDLQGQVVVLAANDGELCAFQLNSGSDGFLSVGVIDLQNIGAGFLVVNDGSGADTAAE